MEVEVVNSLDPKDLFLVNKNDKGLNLRKNICQVIDKIFDNIRGLQKEKDNKEIKIHLSG